MTLSRSAAATDPASDYQLTVGVPMLTREEKLAQLLRSANANPHVEHVVVADNGRDADRDLYDRDDDDLALDVLDLPYDAGLGACRHALVEETDADRLLMVDNDMTIPEDVHVLAEILDRAPWLGAVSGILEEHGHLRAGCTDLSETQTLSGQRALVQEIRDDKLLDWSTGYPLTTADKITNAMLIRRECATDYCWDPELKNGTHEDFALGHYHTTAWEFAVTPTVIFRHFTERDDAESDYYQQFRYGNAERMDRYERLALDKWGYDTMLWGDNYWLHTAPQSLPERVWKALAGAASMRYLQPVRAAAGRIL